MSFRSKLKPKSASDAIEEEARKLKENEETALVLQQFIETFEEPVNVNKSWVKGGVVTPGSSIQSLEGAGKMYQPYLKTAEKVAEKLKEKIQPEIDKASALASRKEQIKKKSNLEAFSEELKQIQQERELRSKRKSIIERVEDIGAKFLCEADSKTSDEMRKSRFDLPITPIKTQSTLLTSPYDLDFPCENENDRTSTNIFLGNLNPELSEQQLCELFGRFGPLASVKIMWPRSDEEKARGRNCGFVAFMNRTDGERALDKLRGQEICGYEMKLGWGKTVLIPPYPVYVPPALKELTKAPPFSGLPFNAQPREWLERQERGLPPSEDHRLYDMFSMTDEELSEVLKDCVVKIVIPADRCLVQMINRMVEFVVREGVEFEAFIMNKEMRNPHFKFLFDFQSPEHVYYRWKLYSILHGDNPKSWKTAEFQMYSGGPYWRPPPMNPYTAGMPEELIVDFDVSQLTLENMRPQQEYAIIPGKEQPQSQSLPPSQQATVPQMENPYNHNNIYKRLLTDSQRQRLLDTLADLEPSRPSIGEAMVWCLEHADSAEEVVDVVLSQLQRSITDAIESSSTTTLNRIVAHMFLLSDILHNSCAKVRNASYYRKFIENVLSQVMMEYNRFYLSITSKVKSEQLKHKILSCFRAWGDWYVYPYDFLLKLQNQFLGIAEPQVAVPSEERPEVETAEEGVTQTMQPLVDYDGDPLDVDGVPLDSAPSLSPVRTSGTQLNNSRHDIIDMFATSPTTKNGADSAPLFVPSKWETVDPAEEESEMVQSRWHLLEETQADDKKSASEDNDDPDGFPLSDNEEDGFDLSKIAVPPPQSTAPVANDRKSAANHGPGKSSASNNQSSLVSYEKESSDEEEVERPKKADKEDRRRPSTRTTREEDTSSSSSHRRPHSSRQEPVEVRSKVIRLEHGRSRRSRSPPRDSRRNKDGDRRSDGGRRRRSRSRTRSRSSSPRRSSHRRRSRDRRR